MAIRLSALAVALLLITSSSRVEAQGPRDQPDRTVTGPERAQVINALGKALRDRYVFPEVGEKLDARLKERLAAKAYDTVTSAKAFSRVLTEDLAAIARDKHLNVLYFSEAPQPRPQGRPAGPDPMASRNYGFAKVERLAGNIGYLKLDAFADPSGEAGQIAAAAMAFLAGTDAMIIDLRQNGGGSPAMVAFLCTYFFEGGRPVHLNSLYWRTTGETQQWWTLGHVPGKRYVDRDVYVLTSSRTFSAGEEFTYNMQTQKRAMIVGETTGGGANPGGMERLSDHFGAFIPSGRAINPITKTNWEGTGVSADMAVAADKALDAAYRDALTKLAAKTRNPMIDRETKDALEKLPATS